MSDYFQSLDIVRLIESNPVSRLSSTCQSRFVEKVRATFTTSQQQLFIASFYCYLNYNSTQDYVIDMENIWKWIGFARKDHCKRVIEKNFVKNTDFQVLLRRAGEQVHGGHNKETILLNIDTFKALCMLAGTDKAKEIRKYYTKLEEIVYEVLCEESEELKTKFQTTAQQLEDTILQLEHQQVLSEIEVEEMREKTLLEQFGKNVQCIYLGIVSNRSNKKEKIIKFGMSNDLWRRICEHKKVFQNFRLVAAFKVNNQFHIENEIKQHPILKKQRRSIIIDGSNYTELLALDDEEFTIDSISEKIKEIIIENEYNVENYKRLQAKKDELQDIVSTLSYEKQELINKNKELEKKLAELTPNLAPNEKREISKAALGSITRGDYFLYGFKCRENRFKCGLCRVSDLEQRTNMFKAVEENGEMKYTAKVHLPFFEKVFLFLLKYRLRNLGTNTFEGSEDEVKLIIDVCEQLERVLVKGDLEEFLTNLRHFEQGIVPPEKKFRRSRCSVCS